MIDIADMERLVERYRTWLKDRTTLKAIHVDWVEITTPFLDRHNDAIQIYAKEDNGGYRLTDDGHTIRELELSGCVLNTPKRKNLLEVAVRGFGVEIAEDILSVRTNADNFAARKHALLQCMLSVNDLFYTASATVRSLFREDVLNWLNLADIRFLENVQFTGQSGFSHQFDFAIPRTKSAPERLLRAISNPSKDAAESLIFSWLDTRQARPADAVAMAILNDSERMTSPSVVDAMRQYDIEPILWSKREYNRPQLAM